MKKRPRFPDHANDNQKREHIFERDVPKRAGVGDGMDNSCDNQDDRSKGDTPEKAGHEQPKSCDGIMQGEHEVVRD